MIRAKKSLGQNFLINDKIIPEIIEAAEINKGDVVIEIGPGLGILTQGLVEAGAQVFAIEKDYDLSAKLQKKYKNTKNLKLVHQDALFFDLSIFNPSTSLGASYKVVSNLPFNVAAPIIRKFLENPNQPELMVLMVQKEVAEKIVAQPGESNRGILTLSVEYYAEAEIIKIVSKNSFRPQPKVDAAVIKIRPKDKEIKRQKDKETKRQKDKEIKRQRDQKTKRQKEKTEPDLFFKIVKAGFSAKRRQIHNSLAATLRLDKNQVSKILQKSEIDPALRAEDLTLLQWQKLCQTITKNDILK